MVYPFQGWWQLGTKMDMEPPYKTSLYINNLSATHSQEENLAWGVLRVEVFRVLTTWKKQNCGPLEDAENV